MKRKTREEKAITLIALIITIVVLLILAVVAINAVTGDGIIQHAVNAKTSYEKAQQNETQLIQEYFEYLEENTGNVIKIGDAKNKVLSKTSSTKVKDEYGNIVVVPAGFKIVVDDSTNNADDVTKGIVIEDCTGAATQGSQFVWIPVGNVYTTNDENKTEDNTKVITLGRYVFDDDGQVNQSLSKTGPNDQLKTTSDTDTYRIEGRIEGLGVDAEGNDTKGYAKNIQGFISSVKSKGGYYLGRYEARVIGYDSINNSNSISLPNWTGYTKTDGSNPQLVCTADNQVWNYVTQQRAAQLSQGMYLNNNATNITSDLINSYSWDTAILFIQEMQNNAYSKQTTKNTGSIANTGTNNLADVAQKDEMCNIWDMASNCREWSTETCSNSSEPEYYCVGRGGRYDSTTGVTSSVGAGGAWHAAINFGFRPILYF